MTARRDPKGIATTFSYYTNGGIAKLTGVTAADGTSFAVNGDSAGLITNVTCSATGQSVNFDQEGGSILRTITDAANITTRFIVEDRTASYLPEIWKIISPYGTNILDMLIHSTGLIQREFRMESPNGDKQQWVLINSLDVMPTNFLSSQIPTNTLLGTLDTTARHERNVFYWSK